MSAVPLGDTRGPGAVAVRFGEGGSGDRTEADGNEFSTLQRLLGVIC